MATFVRNHDGSWRRDDERHDNVLLAAAAVARRLTSLGLEAEVRVGLADEELPAGMRVVVGQRR